MPPPDEPKAPLPEPFAPKGPLLSRLPVRPPPPLRPRLFPDEARFALRLSLLAGGAELSAWVWLAALLASGSGRGLPRAALVAGAAGLAALRGARPLWAQLGTRVPRTALAFALLSVALVADGAALLSLSLLPFPGPIALAAAAFACLVAPGDLAASCAADAITVERRAAAYSWLDMAQGLGLAAGLAVGASWPRLAPAASAAGLFLAGLGVPDLRGRGTPRSAWPWSAYLEAVRTPLGRELGALAFAAAGLACLSLPLSRGFAWLAPAAGMIFAARAEPRAPNAVALPRLLAATSLLAALLALAAPAALGPAAVQLALLALGAAASAVPASVARASPEMERPLLASLAWVALFAGGAAALGARAALG